MQQQINLSLDRIEFLLKLLGNPHKHLPRIVHVAGTNGKGSTCAMLEQLAINEGMKVHRYSSPHLMHVSERIRLLGKDVERSLFSDTLSKVHALVRSHNFFQNNYPTPFEVETAGAFELFSQQSADLIILETGLGGRLDATNVIENTELCIITPISIDHEDFLGNDLLSISKEKFGIIKNNSKVISAHQDKLVLEQLNKFIEHKNASLEYVQSEPDANLNYLEQNLQLSIEAMKILGIKVAKEFDEMYNKTFFKQLTLKGRLQKISLPFKTSAALKTVMLDGTHNAGGALALKQALAGVNIPTHAIAVIQKHKNHENIIALLRSFCKSVQFIPYEQCNMNWQKALRKLCVQEDTKGQPYNILLTGSLYFVGSVLRAYHQ